MNIVGGDTFNPQQYLKGLETSFKKHAREEVNIVGKYVQPKIVQLCMDQTHARVSLATDKQKQSEST